MISKFITLSLFVVAGVTARPSLVARDSNIPALSQWAASGLESYWTFKVRYTSLDCASQQGSDYYNSCCYPLPVNQTAAAECTPSTLTCTGVNPFAAAAVSPSTTTPAATPTDTPQQVTDDSQSDEEDDYDESNLPYCEDPDDDGYYGEDSYDDTSSSDTDDSYTPPADPSPTPDDSGNNDTGDTGSYDNSGSGNTGDYDGNSSGSTGNTGNVNTGGYATFFYQNGVAGACGTVHSDYDLIAAIDIDYYGNTGEVSYWCGKSVTITNTNNGRSVTVTIADVCPTCANSNSIDLSVGAFQAIADLGDGMVPISWVAN